MKFHLLSDLHLEFCGIKLPGGDILLLAGDIVVASLLKKDRTDAAALRHKKEAHEFFFEECAKYKNVIYVAGNHEHYHGRYDETHDIIREFLRGSNVVFLDKDNVEFDGGVVVWGATFWTDMNSRNLSAMGAAANYMNDYHLVETNELKIRGGGWGWDNMPTRLELAKLTPKMTVDENALCREELFRFVKQYPDKKIVVVTHMSPSLLSTHERFKNETLLNFSYSNTGIENFILDNPQIKVWVHGHTHDSHNYLIGNSQTRVICNPRGYTKWENPNFPENVNFDINNSFEI